MCGIVGIFSKDNTSFGDHISKSTLLSSISSLSHRGPDGQNTWTDGVSLLGFRLLSFFGQKATLQPLHNEGQTVHLVCNGEIYNHKELRNRLKKKHIFQTASDCEVIVHLYEEAGIDLLKHIKGQFAFIIWDAVKCRIFAARDRFGICPLYYAETKDHYIFASEVKSILSSNLIDSLSLDIKGIAETLFFYGPTPPRTCFTKICQIPPAHYLNVNLNLPLPKTIISKYWQLKLNQRSNQKHSLTKMSHEFKYQLTQAVKARLQGDFIPGVYASGGLDSSSIAAILSKFIPKVTLFSIRFEDKNYDESYYQDLICRHLNASHQILSIGSKDIINNLALTVWHSESPLIRTAPIPMLLLSRLVRENGYKCVLSGEGADELLAGYPIFQKNQSSIIAKFNLARKVLSLFANNSELYTYINKVFKNLAEPKTYKSSHYLNHCQETEVETKLSRYLLATQGDRVAMASGIEPRFPFLDENLVSLIETLPESSLLSNGIGKVILRQATQGMLPDQIIKRPKQGYLAPDRHFLEAYKTGKTFINDLVSENAMKSSGYFNPIHVKEFLKSVDSSKDRDYTNLGFIFIVTIQILHSLYVLKDSSLLKI